MLEVVRGEVRPQFPVDDRQDVPVERGRHPGRVVVGGDQQLLVLHQIRAEQQRVPGGEQRPHRREERGPLVGEQIADGAAEERDQPGPRSGGQ